ncbi:TetR family transcriptional regulator [Microbacterium sp. P04]|uniref:TetR family transcriptional regulator n=1 Tax=Microbacterium sp. P04 TaxID=3366947 RepID=UPI003744FE89
MSPSPEEPPRTNRGPAAGPGNRRALIDAARRIFEEQGLNAPLSAVARRAGVGQGSLYRHFPDRVALATAAFEENVAELERLVQPPSATLEDLFDHVVEQALPSTAFIELIGANRHDPDVLRLGERFRALVVSLLQSERRAGHVGAHVEVEDVLLSTGMLATELARAEPEDRERVAGRVRALLRRALAP